MAEESESQTVHGILSSLGIETVTSTTMYIIAAVGAGWYIIGSLVFKILKWYVQRKYPPKIKLNRTLHGKDEVAGADAIDAGERFFCYQCAAWRLPGKSEELEDDFVEGDIRLGRECNGCGKFAVPHDWLTALVDFFTEYKPDVYPIVNGRFPLKHFVTVTDRISFVIAVAAGFTNIAGIVYKVIHVPERNKDDEYNMTLIVVAWVELACLVIALLYFGYRSFKILRANKSEVSHRTVQRIAVVVGPMLPEIANVNAIAMVRFWNINSTITKGLLKGYVRNSGPPYIARCLKILNVVASIPAMLVLWLLPAVAVLVRILQLEPNMQVFIVHWDSLMWVNFLAFLNNLRSVAFYPDPLQYFTKQTVGRRLAHPFMDLVERRGDDWFLLAALQYTSTPQELYEVFIVNQSHLYGRPDEATFGKSPEEVETQRQMKATKHKPKLHGSSVTPLPDAPQIHHDSGGFDQLHSRQSSGEHIPKMPPVRTPEEVMNNQ